MKNRLSENMNLLFGLKESLTNVVEGYPIPYRNGGVDNSREYKRERAIV